MGSVPAEFTAAPSEDRKQLIENNLFSVRGLTRPRTSISCFYQLYWLFPILIMHG